ncbi:hypothetical protein [Maridesulfovibrio ferrireducens]|uniref:hypothetical protein n=1 Tax=Maridesulfovibrio ferrireducens TaxID=246191 RepID=UPI001A202260|nr:hypothetical protein [Maridesulfovibrio ferrireducens]MBI9112755.1 hypothetical protein [Maridesulfovibrio ferrireducens]
MKKILIICFILLLALPAMASEFNCQFPPYGQKVDLLNQEGTFLKHKEKNGISYYKYTGGCELNIEKLVSPVVQYFGFIDQKMYCNILTFTLPETLPIEEFEEYCFNLLKGYIVDPVKRTEEGDWKITKCNHSMEGLIIKFKFNRKTRAGKVGWYYTPLRKTDDFSKNN